MVLFDPCLLGLFCVCCILSLLFNYSGPVLSLCLHSCYFGLSWPIPLLMGFLRPFLPSWASSVHSNYTFTWAFANYFGLLRPNFQILYFWGSWALYQPLTYLLHYFWPSLAYSYFPYCPWVYYLFLWAPFLAFFETHLLFFRPMIHYSCHSGFMVFFPIY